MNINIGDKLVLKKLHPCGTNLWEVLRVGQDLKIKCLVCGHQLMKARSKLEKGIKSIEKI